MGGSNSAGDGAAADAAGTGGLDDAAQSQSAALKLAKTRKRFDALRVLDGGLATQLEGGYKCDLNNSLWSTRILENEPNLIFQAHRDFVNAGADLLITCTYQTSLQGFAHDEQRFERSLATAVRVAQEAADAGGAFRGVLVAGSLGPYGAALAGGQEYTGIYELDAKTETAFLENWHLPRAKLLAPCVDLFAGETCPKIAEAIALTNLFAKLRTPGYVSFQCKSGHELASGETIADAVARLHFSDYLLGIGVNCTKVEFVESLIQEIGRALDKQEQRMAPVLGSEKTFVRPRILVYPNSGEEYDATTKTWHMPEYCTEDVATTYVDYAHRWFAAGAQCVGGCCRVLPSHIKAVRDSDDGAQKSQ
ncbi:unnamed protein product [Amoebophrya sp. A120]|nr:unnamed protein product [Amoebophrya sp. A120]|eukprot:GSA120T00003000001.1